MPGMSATTLDQLPEPFLRQLVVQLPAHAKLQLRQCCHDLLEAVDAIGVSLKLLKTTKVGVLSLVSHQVRKLDTTAVPRDTALLNPVQSRLPCVQELRCTVAQLSLVYAIVADNTELRRLQLVWQERDAAEMQLLLRTPGLTSLTSLELDTGCHRFLTAQQEPDSAAGRQQQLLWSLIAAQPELQRLLLHHSKPHNYSIDQCVVKEQYWESVLQQLAGLTRLDMGRRLCSNSSDPVSSGVQQLTVAAPNLKHLRCIGIDSDCEDTWTLAWVGCYTSLTYLDIFFCSAGEIDFDVLGQLKQLRDLALHWYPDEYITTAQLSPLSGCTQLTHLKLDSLLMEQTQEAAAGGLLPTAAVIHAQVLPVTPPAWDGNTRSIGTTRLLQLTMLRKLVAGLMCKQPVAPFAPNLTHLRDLDYDLGTLELPSGFLPEAACEGTSALEGLHQLQMLGVNIFALVRHTAFNWLSQLPNLSRLHIEMVGNLTKTHIAVGGLPKLPHLTRLVMRLPVSAKRNLDKTYSTEEDELIWQHQSGLKDIRLWGTARLGGFLVHDYMLDSMAARLPGLQCVELVKCQDLSAEQLSKLVSRRVARHIVVQSCRNVTARDCMQLQDSSQGMVTVDFE